jgi:hypothetical protein
MSTPDSNFYIMGKSVFCAITNESAACAAIIDDITGITPDQRASFLAGHRDARTKWEDTRVLREQLDTALAAHSLPKRPNWLQLNAVPVTADWPARKRLRR